MIDIFMLIMMIILAVVLLVISLYLLVYYCHPDDAGFGSGLVCKIFAILGLSVCWAQVLLLPLAWFVLLDSSERLYLTNRIARFLHK